MAVAVKASNVLLKKILLTFSMSQAIKFHMDGKSW